MKKKLSPNLIFVLIVLAAALLLWLFTGRAGAGAGRTAVLSYGEDNTELRIPLDEDARYDIDTGLTPFISLWRTAASVLWTAPALTTPARDLASCAMRGTGQPACPPRQA